MIQNKKQEIKMNNFNCWAQTLQSHLKKIALIDILKAQSICFDCKWLK